MKQQSAFLAVPLIVALGCGGQEDGQSQDPGSNQAQKASAERFQKSSFSASKTTFSPRSQGARTETFIVELAGDPVARVQGNAAAPLSASEKSEVRSQIAAAQGGSIRAENRAGPDGAVEGARFVVTLPEARR